MNDETDGYIDTNVFVHSLTNDPHREECVSFLKALRSGNATARLHPLVVHELTYSLPRYAKAMTRQDVGEYVLSALSWPGIVADDPFLAHAVVEWMREPGIQFVDAYLGVAAQGQGVTVFTKNGRDFERAGFEVRRNLPGSE